jgi:2'-5' RNA ligase superfamily
MSFESALVVLVPEAESLVKSFRDQYDPSAGDGVPAHVTILYPFKPPDQLTVDVLTTLQDLVSSLPSFNVSFQKIQEFPDILYLAPMPAEPFKHLTEIIVGTYPENPPYGGAFTEIIPHLTVALASDSQRLDEIAAEFREVAGKELPIHARVNTVSLFDNSNDCWKVRAQFSLGPDLHAS